ncbi:MAG: hypothetical protein HY059_21925 [Proteobacteria bacterium]|nr:hypothetical protein [Pseudomonadota bacterium]
MRTLIIVLAGFALWGLCLGAARLFAGAGQPATAAATGVFVGLWFLAAAANMWVGVTQAGYGFREELPIFLLIFGLPAAVAVVVKFRFL